MNKSEAFERIRKLLRGNGRTAEEHDTAQILAAALAEKHGIDMAEVEKAENQEPVRIAQRQVGEWASCPPEADYAAAICQRFFEVNPIHQCGWSEKILFVGAELHLEIADYIFNFLVREFRWQWNKRRGRCKNRKQFIYGCFIALSNKLNARFARPGGGTALEISWRAKREQYIKESFGELKTGSIAPKQKKGMALEHGYRAGQDIEIRPGVRQGQRPVGELPGFESRLLTNGGTV